MAKLFLVDDDEEALVWMKAALETRGHQVSTFTSGRPALDALSSSSPDLILTDILMPEIDGLAFARLVKRRAGVPVMFVSIAKRQAEAVLAGGLGYIQKPASAAELRSAVERVLGDLDRTNTVLVVDDDPDIRELYRLFLDPEFVVLTSPNGKDALDVMHKEHVDLAIVDVHMPVMNGADLIRAMRRDPELERLPVVVQTSDRAALTAPVWGPLHVAQVMEKESFVDWCEGQMGAFAQSSQ
jgi:CheY-like chemotaxis protein